MSQRQRRCWVDKMSLVKIYCWSYFLVVKRTDFTSFFTAWRSAMHDREYTSHDASSFCHFSKYYCWDFPNLLLSRQRIYCRMYESPSPITLSFYFQNGGSFHLWGESGESETRKCPQDRTPQVDCKNLTRSLLFSAKTCQERKWRK